MKKLIFLSALIPLGLSAQKIAQTHGESIPCNKVWTAASPTKGVTIFTEDFANGIPSTWTNITVSGPVDWKYTAVGHTGNYPTAALMSTSESNGWIIIDSDADNFSGGSAEDAHMTSPIIDCSGFTNVKLEFQQMFRRWASDITTVRITTDGGANFTDFVLNSSITQQGTDNPDYVNIDITTAIAGDPTNVQFVFWWQGAWDYGWQIDDVSVKELDPNDIIIKQPSFDADIEYYQIPETHVQSQDYFAFVSNIGYLDQTNVQIDVNVDLNSSSVFTGTSNPVSTLTVGTDDSLYITTNYIPSTIGNYDVTFIASQTETDDVIVNNSIVSSYQVTDSVYAIDNNNYGGQWWNQNSLGSGSDGFEIGAVYEIINNDKTLTSTVFIGDSSDLGVVFELYLYEYDASTGTSTYMNSTDSYSVTSSDLGNWVTLPWNQGYSSLSAGSTYLASALHYGGSDRLFIGYGTNTAISGSTLSKDVTGGWLNQPRVPMIRLNVDNTLAVEEIIVSNISISPNPTNGLLYINSKNQAEIDYVIYNSYGKMIKSGKSMNNTSINLNTLAKGIYFINIIQKGNSITEKIIIE